MHMSEENWNHFVVSGKVNDYLEYKAQIRQESKQREVRGDKCGGHECYNNRNGAYSNAN